MDTLYNKVRALSEKKHFAVVLFFVYLFLCLFLYRNTIGCRLVTDAQNWLIHYQQEGWGGVLNSFGENAIHPGYHFFFFLTYKLFGTNESGWFFLFCTLHAINAFLLYRVFKSYLTLFTISESGLIALSASFLFLISPYQTEVVVWGATIHYLLVTLITLLTIQSVQRYIMQRRSATLFWIPLLFTIALLCSELAICIPVVIAFLFFTKRFPLISFQKRKTATVVLLPMVMIIVLYFVSNKLILGDWIGHYGAATHLNFSIKEISGNFNKYIFKYMFFGNFIVQLQSEKTLGRLNIDIIIIAAVVVYGVVTALYFLNKNFRKAIGGSFLFIFCFAAGLTAVINLFFNTVPIEGDRLGYLAGSFFFLFFSVFVFALFKKYALIFIFVFSILSFYTLNINLQSWKNAAEVQKGLEVDFKWRDAERVFILNIPDNFNGAYLYRDNGTQSKFGASISLKHLPVHAEIIEILQYNMRSQEDKCVIEVLDSNTLKVSFAQWGNYWWRGGIGASDYENDLCKVDIDEWSHAYIITFKQKKSGDIFLYQNGTNWEQVKGF